MVASGDEHLARPPITSTWPFCRTTAWANRRAVAMLAVLVTVFVEGS
jgi:hypothetical protein